MNEYDVEEGDLLWYQNEVLPRFDETANVMDMAGTERVLALIGAEES
jgi:hypothetical protein